MKIFFSPFSLDYSSRVVLGHGGQGQGELWAGKRRELPSCPKVQAFRIGKTRARFGILETGGCCYSKNKRYEIHASGINLSTLVYFLPLLLSLVNQKR